MLTSLGICTNTLAANSKKRVIHYAETQLQEALHILLALNTSNQDTDRLTKITQRILDVATERQSVRLLQNSLTSHQHKHFERIQEICQTLSPHPLLEAARKLQAELDSQ